MQRRTTLALAFLALAFVSVSAAQDSASPQKSGIEGSVMSLAGAPLKRATLRLQGRNTKPPPPASYATESDAQGNFVFEDIEPGEYTLSAERAGYIGRTYSKGHSTDIATPIKLSPGQNLTGISLKMTPQGVIAGSVMNEDGEPFPNAAVTVYRRRYANGRRQFQPFSSQITRYDGTFAIANLPAGRYYLSAQDPRSSSQREKPGRKGPEQAYTQTYYPGVVEQSQAAPIDVGAGTEVRGIEVELRRQPVVRIRGKVVVSGGGKLDGNINVQLSGAQNPGVFQGVPTGRNGAFEYNRVAPGAYTIEAFRYSTRTSGPVQPSFGRQSVVVSDGDVNPL
ncbi:MAG TPA: carboxypeptidase-like regulatory domain-containing protein [Bryobacteraceae bacterium]|nr:carboxypeptidase-like regulatory domain-containing protein [Bryobacteraceae bacterium]